MESVARFVVVVAMGLLLAAAGCSTAPKSAYDACVSRCLDSARDRYIDNDNITTEEYGRLMQEYKAFVCPGRCEPYKRTPMPTSTESVVETRSPTPTSIPPSPTPTKISTATPPSAKISTVTPTPTRIPTATPSPTPTWTPSPTPTFTPIPLGSLDNPVPAGEPFTMANGWRVTVLSFDSDAWPEVQAENQFNDPPLPGQCMVMIRVRVEYVGEEYKPYIMDKALFTLTGSSGIVFTTYDRLSRCGVIPDPLEYLEGYRGSTGEGNICFQIPNEESGLKLVCDVVSAQYHDIGDAYFKVQ